MVNHFMLPGISAPYAWLSELKHVEMRVKVCEVVHEQEEEFDSDSVLSIGTQ